jgi:hypothetical protein
VLACDPDSHFVEMPAISLLLISYATTHQICLAGPILVTTVLGLAIFLVAVPLSPETKGKVLVAELTVA